MKDNSGRFRFACSSFLLEVDACSQLGVLEEVVLAGDIMSNQVN